MGKGGGGVPPHDVVHAKILPYDVVHAKTLPFKNGVSFVFVVLESDDSNF